MPVASRLAASALLLLSLWSPGCQRGGDFPAVSLRGQRWLVDLATTVDQRYKGLSGRRQLSDGVGMLFIYPKPKVLEFCMRDCYLPLDIAFLDANRRVVKMHTMQVEYDRAGTVAYRSEVPAQYALEAPAGSLAQAGVQVGDQAEFSSSIPSPAIAEPGL